MIICFYSFVLLSLLGFTSSDLTKKEVRTEERNIFLDPDELQLELCKTSLGEHGRCMPLNDCPNLREYAEGRRKDRLLSVIEDFGCGFHKVVFVCCTDHRALKPFEGLDHMQPKDHKHDFKHDVFRHHYYRHPPESFPPSIFHGKERPVITSVESAHSAEIENHKKVGSGQNYKPIFDEIKKPVYEEVEEEDSVAGGRQSEESEESKKDKATISFWESSDFIVSQEDSWIWPNAQKSFRKNPAHKTTPEWLVVHQTNNPSGGVSTGTFNSFESLGGHNSFGSSHNPGGLGIHSQSSSGNYNNQGFSNGNSGFGSGLSSVDNQGFGSSRPGSSFVSNQGFSNGNTGFGSGFSTLDNQHFGSSQPGSSVSSIPDFGSSRPNQGGLNGQGPQVFGSETPTNHGFSNIDRPLSQGFGNERPLSHGSAGFGRPSSYELDNRRPSNSRPGNGGSNRPSSNQESGLFGLGGSSHQRPSNQGSNKKPNLGGSNRRRLLPDGRCGAEISDKIIGGEDTKLDEFPWMALLHFSTDSGQDRGYGCGGSLINDRYVLTAAHCIKGPSLPDNVVLKTVRLGEYDLTKERDCVNGVCSPAPLDVAIEEIIAHPDYKPNDKAQHNDIALIRLRKKVPFTSYVSPICLPGDLHKKKDYAGKRMVVAGWGKTSNGVNAKSSAIKQKVSLPFVTLEECKPFYNGINIRLRNSQMCAGGEKARDSCQGDSGGPLMTNEIVNGQPSWFATGIVSFGPEDCGIKNIAGVYTKVSEYVDWILDNIKE